MPRPVFDVEQYELRGLLPKVFNKDQKNKLNQSIARAQGQIDWSAQLLGFNGPFYWGRPTLKGDGTYDWKGLPETMDQKRQMQTGAFGVFNRHKQYEEWPAPFNRSEIKAAGDAKIHVWVENGKTKLTPYGQEEICDYEHDPTIWAGGMYEFDDVVEFYNPVNIDELVKVEKFSRNDEFWTRMWVLTDAIDMIGIRLVDSTDDYAFVKVKDWEDISDWHHPQVKRQFIGLWGNKGNQLSLDFAFDALELHGFDERNALSVVDAPFFELGLDEVLASAGMVPTKWTGLYWDKFVFKIDGDSLYVPVPPSQIDVEEYVFGNHESCNYDVLIRQTGNNQVIDTFKFEIRPKSDCPISKPCVEWIFDPELDNGSYDEPWIDPFVSCYALDGGHIPTGTYLLPNYNNCDAEENMPYCCEAVDLEYIFSNFWTPEYEEIADNLEYTIVAPFPGKGGAVGSFLGPWATVTEGEYDRFVEPLPASQQGSTCVYDNDEWSSYDDGEFDEIKHPNCGQNDSHFCGEIDGGEFTRTVFFPDYSELSCNDTGCSLIDNEDFEGENSYVGPQVVDGLTKEDPCGINDGGLYGSAHWEIDPTEEEYSNSGQDIGYGNRYYPEINQGEYDGVVTADKVYRYDGCEIVWPDDCIPPDQRFTNPEYFDGKLYSVNTHSWPEGEDPDCYPNHCVLDGSDNYEYGLWRNEDSGVDSGYFYTPYGIPDGGVEGNAHWENEYYDTCYTPGHYACSVDGQPPFTEGDLDGGNPTYNLIPCYYDNLTYPENLWDLDSVDPECYPYFCSLNGGKTTFETFDTDPIDDGVYPDVPEIPTSCSIPDPCFYDGHTYPENEWSLDNTDPDCWPYYCGLNGGSDRAIYPDYDENVNSGNYTGGSQEPNPCPSKPWMPEKPDYYYFEPGRKWGWVDYKEGNCPPDSYYVFNCESDLNDCEETGPCPIDDVHVRIRFIDKALFKIHPSIQNSATPLRIWKDHIMTVADGVPSNVELDFRNFLVADENRGPNNHDNFRSYVRLPLEYQRGGKQWNKAVQACNNQQYLQNPQRLSKPEYIEGATPELPIYDESYDDTFDPSQNFYHEDFLVSTLKEDTTDMQDSFTDASVVYEVEEFSPFDFFSMSEYNPYDYRMVSSQDGNWKGFYLRYGLKQQKPTGHLSQDIDDQLFSILPATEEPIYDESYVKRPNIDFPDEIDSAELKNYVLGYAYFSADFSAADEPVFDPTDDFCWRHNSTVCLTGDYPECHDQEIRVNTGYLLHAQFTNETYGRTNEGVVVGGLDPQEAGQATSSETRAVVPVGTQSGGSSSTGGGGSYY